MDRGVSVIWIWAEKEMLCGDRDPRDLGGIEMGSG